MSYQQPGNWSDPSWPSQQSPYADPNSPYADPAAPVSGQQASPAGYPGQASPAGYPGGYAPAYQSYPGYGYPAASPPTNGMAIASMVVSIVSIVGLCGYGIGGLLGILGAILGHVARRQIRERGENGDGMALAGVVMGWIAAALGILIIAAFVIFVVWAANQPPTTPPEW
ncbi:MAG TPA: DUF4190 domain-containing protein [Pilimelia sp.]|nr:DUF4190 domain-containing protein [Pilimelia sp.]